jgi:histidinol-phosphate aminotransferase
MTVPATPGEARVIALLREDLRDFAGYSSARSARLTGEVWLNANESARPAATDAEARLRRYPEPQPPALREALAALYGVVPAQLLAGRGSDEAIDLLLRATCLPGRSAVLTTPPVFGMYAVCARLHGARVIEVPLLDAGDAWRLDAEAVADAALGEDVRLVFVCSPGNPTGQLVPSAAIETLAARLAGQALVVVDEAYIEFAEADSAIPLLPKHPNLVVLRTLSKAHALAAARIGVAIAHPALIAAMARCQAPYPLATPSVEAALAALAPGALAATRERVAEARGERLRLAPRLAVMPGVQQVYPSAGNFLLLRHEDVERAFVALLAADVVVRDMRGYARLGDALRISLGTPEQNDRVVAVLASLTTGREAACA